MYCSQPYHVAVFYPLLYPALHILTWEEVVRCVEETSLSSFGVAHIRLYHHRVSPGESEENQIERGELLMALAPQVSQMLDLRFPLLFRHARTVSLCKCS